MIGAALLVLQLATAQTVAQNKDRPFPAVEAVPDPVLAEQRGGIRLPSGIDLALSIDTVTAVDGAIVLQTVTKIADGAPVTTTFAPEDGRTIALPENASSTMTASHPRITYDRQNRLRVTGGGAIPVSFSTGQSGTEPDIAEGLRQVDPTAPVQTASGVVQEDTRGIALQGTDIRVLHLAGNAFGSAIVNSGSDRAIDTYTTLSIDLRNAGPDVLGSTMLRIDGLASDTVAGRF